MSAVLKNPLSEPLPLKLRPAEPLPGPSDWSFELIEQYHKVIRDTAERFGLDTYPNQLEIIAAEQMMDAYASVGMPVNYRHWSYGKEFIATEKNYKRGHMGLAYEIVINSNPCISYLMEENTMAMHGKNGRPHRTHAVSGRADHRGAGSHGHWKQARHWRHRPRILRSHLGVLPEAGKLEASAAG